MLSRLVWTLSIEVRTLHHFCCAVVGCCCKSRAASDDVAQERENTCTDRPVSDLAFMEQSSGGLDGH